MNENKIKFCEHCKKSDWRYVVVDRIESTISEYKIICNNCNKTINQWEYGFYENYKSPEYIKMELQIERQNKLNAIKIVTL
jgi:hypothetical protein